MIRELAKRYQLNEESILAVINEVFCRIHETSYKKSVEAAIIESRWQFGEEVCWHLFGIIMESYKDNEYCNDAGGGCLYQVAIKEVRSVAQASRLCKRRLKSAATGKITCLNATWYYSNVIS